MFDRIKKIFSRKRRKIVIVRRRGESIETAKQRFGKTVVTKE